MPRILPTGRIASVDAPRLHLHERPPIDGVSRSMSAASTIHRLTTATRALPPRGRTRQSVAGKCRRGCGGGLPDELAGRRNRGRRPGAQRLGGQNQSYFQAPPLRGAAISPVWGKLAPECCAPMMHARNAPRSSVWERAVVPGVYRRSSPARYDRRSWVEHRSQGRRQVGATWRRAHGASVACRVDATAAGRARRRRVRRRLPRARQDRRCDWPPSTSGATAST